MKRLVSIFDNSLTEIVSNFLKPRKRTQQYSNLCINFFISNFHCRYELNKAEHNNNPPIASKTLTTLKVLHRNPTHGGNSSLRIH